MVFSPEKRFDPNASELLEHFANSMAKGQRSKGASMKCFSTVGRLSILVMLLALTGCGPREMTQAAEQEVKRFHERWNEGEFTGIYNDAHMRFRSVQPANVTIGAFQRGKRNFGPFKSTRKRSSEVTQDKGEPVIVLKYDSAYEHGAAVERFGFRMSGNTPLLADYELLSPQSAAKEEAMEKEQQARAAKSR
ncbi:MAG: hypothetical protein QOH39_991 [Verrucomicrobiota bacterium]|jgi:hypothetical protein